MKKTNIFLLFIFLATIAFAKEVKPVKNVILMIPDGTSIGFIHLRAGIKYK